MGSARFLGLLSPHAPVSLAAVASLLPPSWTLTGDVWESLFILVEPYLSFRCVNHVVALTAIVCDAIGSFELMHREDVRNSVQQVTLLNPSVCSPQVCCHRTHVAIDFTPPFTAWIFFRCLSLLKAVIVEHLSRYALSSGNSPPWASVTCSN